VVVKASAFVPLVLYGLCVQGVKMVQEVCVPCKCASFHDC
jgi:hypothetical protein